MKNIKSEKFNIIPDKSLFPKLGQAGYSLAEAIAELVDNSIDSRFIKDCVDILITIDKKNQKIEIEDNGSGMDKNTAKQSIILGSSNKKEGQLGQFGLGLKTATMSLGKKFTVQTTQKNSKEEYILVFDEDEFLKNGSWNNFNIKIKSGIEKEKSGTRITIEKLKISLSPNVDQYVTKQLQNRFSPFINNKEAKIKINGALLKPERISLVPNSKKYFKILLQNGDTIWGWTSLLLEGSFQKSGFNMYRRNRLIRAYEKLGYQYHPSKMSVTGEINLDCIPVTHNKREFITEDPLYVEFYEKFQKIIEPILREAQKRQSVKKIEDLTQEVRETLKDNLLKAIENVDEFQELAHPSGAGSLKRSGSGELFQKEKRGRKKKITDIKEIKGSKHQKGRNPKKLQTKKERFITIAGKKYKFDWEWRELEEDIIKASFLDKERGLIIVTLNSNFPALHIAGKDIRFYIAIYVSEGLVEEALRANSRSLDKVLELRDKIILKLAKITTEDLEEKIEVSNSKISKAQNKIMRGDLEGANLSKREIEVLKLRLGLDGNKQSTLQAVGVQLRITRERVRQIERRALEKINK